MCPECHQDLEITMENQLESVMRRCRPGAAAAARSFKLSGGAEGPAAGSSADCP